MATVSVTITDADRLEWLARRGAEIAAPYSFKFGFRYGVTPKAGKFAGVGFGGETLREAIDLAMGLDD